jgi:hypothetical protein
MACFIVPTTLGLITTSTGNRFPKEWHISWLNIMIWGGTIALAVEHYAHGEIVPWPPFLTAMSTPADTVAMFAEMALVGIPMTIALVAAWAVMIFAHARLKELGKLRLASAATN